jgi:hypothetical protein
MGPIRPEFVGRGVIYFLLLSFLGGVRVSPLGTVATTDLLYQPQMIGEGNCGAISGTKIGRESRSTRRKLAPVPHWHHKSHMTRSGLEPDRRDGKRPTAWAMARPSRPK